MKNEIYLNVEIFQEVSFLSNTVILTLLLKNESFSSSSSSSSSLTSNSEWNSFRLEISPITLQDSFLSLKNNNLLLFEDGILIPTQNNCRHLFPGYFLLNNTINSNSNNEEDEEESLKGKNGKEGKNYFQINDLNDFTLLIKKYEKEYKNHLSDNFFGSFLGNKNTENCRDFINYVVLQFTGKNIQTLIPTLSKPIQKSTGEGCCLS